MASLTREEMEAEIRLGRSILFSPTVTNPGGTIATTMEHLPSLAALAAEADDPVKKQAALDAINAQRKALDDQEALLNKPAPKVEPKVEPKVDPDPKPKSEPMAPAESAPTDPKPKAK